MSAPQVRLAVVEIFGPTIQGEGRQIGLKTMFVRLAGCDWGCQWCDSAFTWRPGELAPSERLEASRILARLAALDPACRRLTLSGGNPALQDCGPLVAAAHAAGYTLHVETQGSRAPAWLAAADSVTISPKGPSSGMRPDWPGLAATLAVARDPELKVVIFDDADLQFAATVRERHPGVPFTLQLGNRVGADDAASLLARQRDLSERVLADPAWGEVRVLPQLHVLLWGNRRGV